MGYDIENVGRAVEHLTHKVADLTEATTDNTKEEKENAMSDLLDNIKGRLTPEELEQFHKFRSECLAKQLPNFERN